MAQAITFTQAEDLVRRKTDPNVADILRDAPQAIFSHTVMKGTGRDTEDLTLLFIAIQANNKEAAEVIIDRIKNTSRDISWQNSKGTSALHLAVRERNESLAKLLLDRGAEPSPRMRRDDWTPLHTATSRRNNFSMVKILMDGGADINAQVKITGWSPLHGALAEDDMASVEYLILKGANLNIKGSKRLVANGVKLTPKELAEAVGFGNMSLFGGAKMTASKVEHVKQGGKSDVSVQEVPKPIGQHDGQKWKAYYESKKSAEKGEEKKILGMEATKRRNDQQNQAEGKLNTQQGVIAVTQADLDAMVQAKMEKVVIPSLGLEVIGGAGGRDDTLEEGNVLFEKGAKAVTQADLDAMVREKVEEETKLRLLKIAEVKSNTGKTPTDNTNNSAKEEEKIFIKENQRLGSNITSPHITASKPVAPNYTTKDKFEYKEKKTESKAKQSLDNLIESNSSPWLNELVKLICETLPCETIDSLMSAEHIPSEVKDVALLMLHMICESDEIKQAIAKHSSGSVPVENFTSHESVEVYLEALISSGTEGQAKSMLYIVGNTGIGKTSLMRTVKRFCDRENCAVEEETNSEMKTKVQDISFLTEDNMEFIETQVVDVITDVTLKESEEDTVSIVKSKGVKKACLQKRNQRLEENETNGIVVNIYDVGGHRAYFIASSLFMRKQGTFIVAFNGQDVTNIGKNIIDAEKYHQTIGTFLELICQNCENPCIQLVATKMDSGEGNKALWKDIWEKARDHLNSFNGDERQLILSDEILNTSSKEVSEEQMKALVSKTASLLLHKEITEFPSSGIPVLWRKVVSGNDTLLKVPVSELQEKLDNMKEHNVHSGEARMDSKKTEMFTKLQKNVWQHIQQPETKKLKQENSREGMVEEKESVKVTQKKIELNEKASEEKVPLLHLNGSEKEDANDNSPLNGIPNNQSNNQSAKSEISEELMLILKTFASTGDILWFHTKEYLKTFIVPNPMNLIRALRCVITHDLEDLIQKEEAFEEVGHWGGVNAEAFKILFRKSKEVIQNFSEDDIKFFLEHLGLATPTKTLYGKSLFFVPSLIDDANEDDMRNHIKTVKNDQNTLKIIFMLPKISKKSQLFQRIVSQLASEKNEFKKGGIEFEQAFGQKIENSKTGEVAALRGRLRWTFAFDPEDFEFTLVDLETNISRMFHSSHKGLAIYIRPLNVLSSAKDSATGKKKCKVVMADLFWNQIKDINSEAGFKKGLLCQDCENDGKVGYFTLDENFRLKDQHDQCSPARKHRVTTELHDVMSSTLEEEKKGFSGPTPLMKGTFTSIPEEKIFTGEQMLEKIKSGDVKPGTQIWIWRSKEENCIAARIDYAHVLVYIGKKDDDDAVHEVVHVDKLPFPTGCNLTQCFRICPLMSTFQSADVDKVLKTTDRKVFFGHDLPGFQTSVNARPMIRKRALACTEEPKLKFHYNQKDNCEGFANLIMGMPGVEQDPSGFWGCCFKLFCSCINCCKSSRTRTLENVVMNRLKEKDLWPEDDSYKKT